MEKIRLYYSPAEAASAISCSRSTVYRAIKAGTLKAFRPANSNQLKIRLSDLTRFVESQTVAEYIEPPIEVAGEPVYEIGDKWIQLNKQPVVEII